jgi:hypothetical protein
MLATSKPSILVATPAFGCQVYTSYLVSILRLDRLCKARDIDIDFVYRHDSLITRGRNTLSNIFLNSNFTHMLFIDADMEFDAEHVLRMIEADKPLISGRCNKKEINWERIVTEVNKPGALPTSVATVKNLGRNYAAMPLASDQPASDGSVSEVLYAGTGFLMIKKEVLERLRDRHAEDHYFDNGVKMYRFFDGGVVDGQYLSEDYWFCHRWRQLGGKVYMMHDFQVNHWGVHCFD